MVTYGTGKFAKAPEWLREWGYHLTAFDTLEHARACMKYSYSKHFEMWEAEGKDRVKRLEMFRPEFLSDGVLYSVNGIWPKGTMMFKEIKLIRRVA